MKKLNFSEHRQGERKASEGRLTKGILTNFDSMLLQLSTNQGTCRKLIACMSHWCFFFFFISDKYALPGLCDRRTQE